MARDLRREKRERIARARAVLDRARAGGSVSSHAITQALIDSGDLNPDAVSQVRRPAGTWERKNVHLMSRASWFDPMHALN